MESSKQSGFIRTQNLFTWLIRRLKAYNQKLSRPKPQIISTVVDQAGVLWEVDSRLALDRHKILRSGSMVPDFVLILWDNLDLNKTAIDVGANAGYWTLPMSLYFSKVIAFEPNLIVRQKLSRNVDINQVMNVEVRSEMCGSKCGVGVFFEISMEDGDGLMNNGLSGSLNRGLNVEPVRKNQITLDSLGITEVAFVKIDVEGMEIQVFSGAASLILAHPPIFFWEASRTLDRNHNLTNVPDSLEFLSVNHYYHFMFLENEIVELSPDLSNIELNRDFDVLSVPSNQIDWTRSLLKDFGK